MAMRHLLAAVVVLSSGGGGAFASGSVAIERSDDYVFEDIDSVRVDALSFDVVVEGSEGSSARAEIIYPDNYSYRCEKIDVGDFSVLSVSVVRESMSLFNPARLRIALTIPSGSAVDIRTGAGNVKLAKLGGPLSVRTFSGDIDLSGRFPSAEDASGGSSLSTFSGTVRIDRCASVPDVVSKSGDVRLSASRNLASCGTSSGNILIDGYAGPLRLRTGSGDVRGRSVAPEGTGVVRTGSGSVRLELANPRDGGAYRMRTRSGTIDCFGRRAEKSLDVGTGSLRLDVETGAGDIVIE